ncbi:tannase and feruloyl esterase family protein [Umbelopsis sp. PMI_123]|nr:tannase and feruloyl esterase family protein [Umbelopsis sp. PMI_123]
MRAVSSIFGSLALIKVLRVSTKASLNDVCTTSYVQSVLPTDDFIEGIKLSSTSVTSNPVTNYTGALGDLNPSKNGLDFCNVTFSYSDGLSITSGEMGLEVGIVCGAVAGTTDGGFGGWSAQISDVILAGNGTLNDTMLNAFSFRAIHEMTVIGKELSRKFYNTSDFYSYYQGCSEGGREGWSQVQRYGTQFDGAAIGAPAFGQAFQQANHLFSGLVEIAHDYYPSSCELERITNDTIAACDALDGKVDGVVSRTDLCKLHYDPKASIGNSCKTTYNSATGKYEYVASGIAVSYINLFLKEIDSDTLSLTNFSNTLQTNWPHLEDFHNNGGKVIHFHGESDPVFLRIRRLSTTMLFARSCTRTRPLTRATTNSLMALVPRTVLESVIDWVENGINPTMLNATVSGGTTSDVDQKIRSFPLRPYWKDNSTMECVYDKKSIDTWLPNLDSIPIPVY